MTEVKDENQEIPDLLEYLVDKYKIQKDEEAETDDL